MNSHKMCEKLKVSITYAVSLTDQCCSPKVEQNNSIEIFVIVTSLALRALANRSAKFRSHRRILVTSFLTLLREIILLQPHSMLVIRSVFISPIAAVNISCSALEILAKTLSCGLVSAQQTRASSNIYQHSGRISLIAIFVHCVLCYIKSLKLSS